jgi:hypothetical protein
MVTRSWHKYWLFIFIVFNSCTSKPLIPISDTLETSLHENYSNYVLLLNKSINGDTTALNEFLIINNIYDVAGYDHGWVLIELMKKLGDKQFSNGIAKLNSKQFSNLKEYFRVGLDENSQTLKLSKSYPITFNLFKFTEKELS